MLIKFEARMATNRQTASMKILSLAFTCGIWYFLLIMIKHANFLLIWFFFIIGQAL